MYDDFHVHLVETNLKIQESNMHGMHGELRRSYHEIFTKEMYRTSRFTEFNLMRSVKDIDSTTSWRRLCCFAYIMKIVFNHAKEYKKDEKPQEGFQQLFLCSCLSTILDRNSEADFRLSCLSQMSMIAIIVPYMNKSPIGKRQASICSVSVNDVPNVV